VAVDDGLRALRAGRRLVLSAVIAVIIVFADSADRHRLHAAGPGCLNPLDHKVFQLVFGATMTLLIAMEFKHSIVARGAASGKHHPGQDRDPDRLIALARKFVILDPEASPAKWPRWQAPRWLWVRPTGSAQAATATPRASMTRHHPV
jgi:hypothetical protein